MRACFDGAFMNHEGVERGHSWPSLHCKTGYIQHGGVLVGVRGGDEVFAGRKFGARPLELLGNKTRLVSCLSFVSEPAWKTCVREIFLHVFAKRRCEGTAAAAILHR